MGVVKIIRSSASNCWCPQHRHQPGGQQKGNSTNKNWRFPRTLGRPSSWWKFDHFSSCRWNLSSIHLMVVPIMKIRVDNLIWSKLTNYPWKIFSHLVLWSMWQVRCLDQQRKSRFTTEMSCSEMKWIMCSNQPEALRWDKQNEINLYHSFIWTLFGGQKTNSQQPKWHQKQVKQIKVTLSQRNHWFQRRALTLQSKLLLA